MEEIDLIAPVEPKENTKKWWWLALIIFALSLLYLLVSYVLVSTKAPSDFVATTIQVESGQSIKQITIQVAAANIVRSERILYFVLLTKDRNLPIKAGSFTFSEPLSVFAVSHLLTHTTPQDELLSVTFPEGLTVRQYAQIATAVLPKVSVEDFIAEAGEAEGLLWPETYFVPPDYDSKEIVALLKDNHKKNIEQFAGDIANSKLTENDVVILASIVEREANDEQSMKMVAGVLLNRLDIGMPLQADATISYILKTPLNELPAGQLADELRETDSPYNTYLYRGLPPTPIGNPGEMAIAAVLHPIISDNFYYITGNDGEFHYAKTLSEHNRNINLYLRR